MFKKGIAAENLTQTILWVIFAIIAGFSVMYLLKRVGIL